MMPEIKLTHITKRWKNFFGVDDLSMVIPDNSFITLLGPSGCGKTTILRMIAGLETPTEGQIKIGDKVVFDSDAGINVPANKRKVGFLFQNYALWPNMTVFQNISFGLRNIKEELPKTDDRAKVASDMIRALQNGKKLRDTVEECRDKNGKLDMQKVYVKLIDSFTLSMMTAKELFSLNVHADKEPQRAADEKRALYEKKLSDIRASYEARGERLDERHRVTKDGKVQKEVRKLTEEQIDSRVRAVSRIVKIGMFMDRYPAELSGGQQQRVAIARTLAPEPQVLFMDEPLSNLDAKLRLEMRYELQRLHVETGSTFVYVTHDQMEAMTLATRICLVNNGVLQQYEAPLSVYNRPANLFAADFVGNPSINFVEAKGEQGEDGEINLSIFHGVKARFVPNEKLNLSEWFSGRDREKEEVRRAEAEKLKKKHAVEKQNKDEVFQYHVARIEEEDTSIQEEPILTNEDLVLGIRPEAISIAEDGVLDTVIYGAMPTGSEATLKISVQDDYLLTAVIFGNKAYQIGQKSAVQINGSHILLFDRQSGKRITDGSLIIERM